MADHESMRDALERLQEASSHARSLAETLLILYHDTSPPVPPRVGPHTWVDAVAPVLLRLCDAADLVEPAYIRDSHGKGGEHDK